MSWKSVAKKIHFINELVSFYRCYKLKQNLNNITHYYKKACLKNNYQYDEITAIKLFKQRHKKLNPLFDPKTKGDLRIFWVGTTKSQDESGFLQALKKIAYVFVYNDVNGNYGIWTGKKQSGSYASFEEIRISNAKLILEQFSKEQKIKPFDLFLGQMWSNYITTDVLSEIRCFGVPVINIAMDDRLPDHWSWKGNIRLGSIGLWPNVDMVLTTCSNTCSWYGVEGCPSIFWPLASSTELFKPKLNIKKDINVLFIGNKYGIRSKVISFLEKNNVKVECFGKDWPNGFIDAKQIFELSKRAKIILGIGTVGHCSDVYTLKLRDFDSLMSGALYITHKNDELTKLFDEGIEIEYYNNFLEAYKKIQFYLDNPEERKKIGLNGMKKTSNLHNWDIRLESTFSKLGILNSK